MNKAITITEAQVRTQINTVIKAIVRTPHEILYLSSSIEYHKYIVQDDIQAPLYYVTYDRITGKIKYYNCQLDKSII